MNINTCDKVITASAEIGNPLYPDYGELWDCEGRIALIAANTIEQNAPVWVMELSTGEMGNAHVSSLLLRKDRHSLSQSDVVNLFTTWAFNGNSHAMWWLGWWYEGVNHQRSVWFYIAALRAAPDMHGWALGRIISDARSAIMCRGVPEPRLIFLDSIPEIKELKIHTGKWKEAIINAAADDMQP